MKIVFEKYQGAGNDFVVIDNRRRIIRDPAGLARKVCDRHKGIGADGLLLVESSRKADFRMMYYNADGSYGGMCGNGGRCISMFAFKNGIAPRLHRFVALGHIYEARVIGATSVSLHMKDPRGLRLRIPLKGPAGKFVGHFLDTGSPHVVVPVSGRTLARLEVGRVGSWIRHSKLFRPQGANANFVHRVDAKSLEMRTYERGVEAETLACGTGSVACSIVASEVFSMKPPIRILTRSGDRLRVTFEKTPAGYRNVILHGPATKSFSGVIDV